MLYAPFNFYLQSYHVVYHQKAESEKKTSGSVTVLLDKFAFTCKLFHGCFQFLHQLTSYADRYHTVSFKPSLNLINWAKEAH